MLYPPNLLEAWVPPKHGRVDLVSDSQGQYIPRSAVRPKRDGLTLERGQVRQGWVVIMALQKVGVRGSSNPKSPRVATTVAGVLCHRQSPAVWLGLGCPRCQYALNTETDQSELSNE